MKNHYVEWHRNGEDFKSGDMSEERARAHYNRVKGLKGTSWAQLVETGQEVVEHTYGSRDVDRLQAPRQYTEPDPAYEAAHSTAHNLLQVIGEKLHDLPAPESGSVTWDHVRFVIEINRFLLTVIDMLEKETR